MEQNGSNYKFKENLPTANTSMKISNFPIT